MKRDISVSGVYATRLTNAVGYTVSLPMAFTAEAHLADRTTFKINIKVTKASETSIWHP
jgi:hypothetical protein